MTDGMAGQPIVRHVHVAAAHGEAVLLVVDLGGTWMRMGAVDAEGRWCAIDRVHYGEHSPVRYLARFQEQYAPTARHACIAVAGPVMAGRVRMTNRPWTLERGELCRKLGLAAAWLINDLQAFAHALPLLGVEDVAPLRGNLAYESGPVAVIAPGTGLGEAFVLPIGDRLIPVASEGGHSEFAPRNAAQEALLTFTRGELSQVEFEAFCSGPGLARIYRFLVERAGAPLAQRVATALREGTDPTPAIAAAALEDDDACCREALTMWCDILAAEGANLALKVMATGGVCFAGGMVNRFLPLLQSDGFIDRFDGNGPMTSFLRSIPLAVVHCIDAPLIGAARYGLEGM